MPENMGGGSGEGMEAKSTAGSMGELADRQTQAGFPSAAVDTVSGSAYVKGSEAMNGGATDEKKY